MSERWLGLSEKRSLPRWRRDTFATVAPSLGLASREQVLAAARDGLGVVLFVDTFADGAQRQAWHVARVLALHLQVETA